MRRMQRVLGWSLALPLALVLLVSVALGVLLGTPYGGNWLLRQVPGLQVEAFDGRLGGEWQAERILWEQDGMRAEVSGVQLAWTLTCLLKKTLCLENLQVREIDLQLPPADDQAASEPFQLDDIHLPLELRLEQVDIGPLRLNAVEQWQSLNLRADWRRDGVKLRMLRLQREDLLLTLNGRLQPQGDWPLTLRGDAAIQLPGLPAWTLKLVGDGELREHLMLGVESQGYLKGSLGGWVRPLEPQLPAKLHLTVSDFQADPSLPEALLLEHLELAAQGDLKNGYRLSGDGQLRGEGGPVSLAVNALLDASQIRLNTFQLEAGEAQRLSLNGHLGWTEGLQGEAQLAWRDFPWRQLYPDIDEPPVSLRRLDALVQYDSGRYLGNFDGDLTGPAGDFSLRSPFSGDLGMIHLPQFELIAGQGQAMGNLSLGFADGIDWNTRLALSKFDPAYWLAELSGELAGNLNSRGVLRDGELQAEAALDLNGTLRRQPLQLQMQASGEGSSWSVPQLSLRLGDNRIQGEGRWAETLRGDLQLNLARLGQLWPGLQGQLSGTLALTGTPQAPSGELTLAGTRVGYQDNRVGKLALKAALSDGLRGQLRLQADRLEAGDVELGNLHVSGEGTEQAHQVSVQLEGGMLDLRLATEGRMYGADWRGRLRSLRLQAEGQNWQLREPATLERLGNGTITVGSHCLEDGPASLCAEPQRLQPDPQLRYRLRDFPLQSLASYLPDNLRWMGLVDADISLDLPAAGPTGTVRLDAGPGTLQLREGEDWFSFPYSTLSLGSELTHQRINSLLQFEGGELGTLEVRLAIDPGSKDKTIEGDFTLNALDLSVVRPFVTMVDRLEGQLNGSGLLSGSLRQPQVNGELRLLGGEMAGNALPVSVEQLQLSVLIEGQSLKLDGDWKSGAEGRGTLAGSLNWRDAPTFDLQLRGSSLPLVVEPYAELEFEPDLRLQLAEGQLAVSGKVGVPRGEIIVRELPPSTVSVSPDAQIVGEETEPDQALNAIHMDIDVEVGQERLRFSGFGLTADLVGHLHIGDNLDARGELNLNNGRYRAYGQRLNIRRAQLLFTGVLSQPFLNIEAVRRIEAENVTAGLRITGSTEQPRLDVFAEPAMSQEQALAYLVLGRPLGADSGDNNMLAQAALGLGLAGSASITGSVAQHLGIQDFQLDTEGSGSDTSVVASGRLTDRLTVRYGVGVFEPANTLAIRYQLTRRIFLEAASGLASSLDIFYRRNF